MHSLALAGLAALGVGLLGAPPARAAGDFANGFEDQLGRLAAFEVARVGRFLLTGFPDPRPHPAAFHRHHFGYRQPWRLRHAAPIRRGEPCGGRFLVERRFRYID